MSEKRITLDEVIQATRDQLERAAKAKAVDLDALLAGDSGGEDITKERKKSCDKGARKPTNRKK